MSYADVNGICMYYEEHGTGQPLILLHGGYATSETYAAILPPGHRSRATVRRSGRSYSCSDQIVSGDSAR